jgi:hypothetical protein
MTMEPREPRRETSGLFPARWTRMRFVRCEACGAKALVAASQCPQCGIALELRNSHGDPIPLAHCENCDLYYPRSRGECRWCGTKSPGFPTATVGWSALGLVAAVGIGWVAWWARSDGGVENTTNSTAQMLAVAPIDPASNQTRAASDSAIEPTTVVFGATNVDSSAGAVATDSTPGDNSTLSLSPDSASNAHGAAVSMPFGQTPATESAGPSDPARGPASNAAPPPSRSDPPASERATSRDAAPRARAATPPPTRARPAQRPPARTAVRWVGATVRGWVRIRASATRQSRTIVVLGPDTRLQVGELRGTWQRVRSGRVNGWAERADLLHSTSLRQ